MQCFSSDTIAQRCNARSCLGLMGSVRVTVFLNIHLTFVVLPQVQKTSGRSVRMETAATAGDATMYVEPTMSLVKSYACWT